MPLELGWDASTDPCDGSTSKWGETVRCFENGASDAGLIKAIDLQSLGLNGTIDAELLCAAPALRVVSLQNNTLRGGLPASVSACSELTHLYVDHNWLSGALPSSLGNLSGSSTRSTSQGTTSPARSPPDSATFTAS